MFTSRERELMLLELENKLDKTEVKLSLEFIIRTMKALELASSMMENTIQRDTVDTYANTLFHEITEHITHEDLIIAEENQLLSEL